MSSRSWMPLAALVLLAVLALAVTTGCGGDDGDTTPGTKATGASQPAATEAPDDADSTGDSEDADGESDAATDGENEDGDSDGQEPAAGRIVVTSSPISGQKDKILLVFGPANASEACARIEGDGWSLPETALRDRDPDSDPCSDLGAESMLDPGEYFLTVSVVVPGEQSASATASVPVRVVDGDARVEIDGSKLSGSVQAGDPGRILVTSSQITGQAGKILVVMGQGNAGSVCAMIESDSWSMPEPVAMTELPGGEGGPCGEHTPEVAFPPGDNVVTASVYVPGETSARATTQVLVTVDGDVTAAVDGTALSVP